MSFPALVFGKQTPGVPGMRASGNPMVVVNALEGLMVAGTACAVGSFGWSNNGTVTNAGSGAPTGLVIREADAIISTYLAEGTLNINQGFPVTVASEGDFWVTNSGTGAVTPGMTAYASNTTGAVEFASTGTITGFTATKWTAQTPGVAGDPIIISGYPMG
jgi:hypothetical protein